MHPVRKSSSRIGRAALVAMPAVLIAGFVASPAPAEQDLFDDRPMRVRPVLQAQPGGGALDPNSFYGKESTEGVCVRDSAVALEKFALAQRMERLKEWNKSADVYQEILEKYPDRVVPSQIDKDNNIYQYTSVATAVQEKLARWPDDGLSAYRARYENTAATMLEQAGTEDFERLNRICSLYFVTDSSKKAAIRLIDLYLEAGEFPAA